MFGQRKGRKSLQISCRIAPPVDGRANQALCRLFADWCGIPKSGVELKSGQTGRSKVLELAGVTPEELKAILTQHMEK